MKQIKLTFVLTLLMSMVGLQAFADFDTSTKINSGLYYYLDKDNLQAQVTEMPSGKYTGNITIPSYIYYSSKKYTVTSIGEWAFYFCSDLTSVTIPNSVTSISNNAFNNCSGLTSVTIPNSVTEIGNYAFTQCTSLTSVTIPNSVTSISNYAFNNCSNLTSITIPNSVTSIGDAAFMDCTGLTSVTIPSGVTSIGGSAFKGCTSLTSITIPNSVTSIGDGAFNRTAWYNNQPDGVVYAGLNLYNYKGTMPNNTSVTINQGTVSISKNAFYGCSGLTSITIPNSVTSIGVQAFYGCSGLTSITIPNSVTSIGDQAFRGCSGLTSITIGSGVTSIGNYAFANCTGLTSVTIPNSVTSIGDYAFYGCSTLTSVTVDIITPLAITKNTFPNRANATLYVINGCKSAYEAASFWKGFGTIKEITVTIAMKTGSGVARSMIAYSSKYALDFTDRPEIRAYIACGYSGKNKDVLLLHVNVVPPYTGMVIKTTNGTYDGGEYEVPTTNEVYYYVNMLMPVVETGTVTPTETIDDEEYTNFSVGTLVGGKIGFVRLTSNWTTHNKSYLRVPTWVFESSANARQQGGFGIVFEDDETTGIDSLENPANTQQDKDAPMYNISGQRVDAGYKGVVIQNGKKLFIK